VRVTVQLWRGRTRARVLSRTYAGGSSACSALVPGGVST